MSTRRNIVTLAVAVMAVGVVLVTASRRPPHHNSTLATMATAARGGDHGEGVGLATAPDAGSDGAAPTPLARAVPSGESAPLDAAAREAMRRAIWGALGEAAPDSRTESQSATAYVLPVAVPDPSGTPGGMEPSYIQDRVRHDFFPFALDCYSEALKKTSDLAGTVVLRFIIVGDSKIGGIVESVDVLDKSTLRDPAMIECIRESFLGTKFPPPQNGGWVSVEYPITFGPDDDDDDDDDDAGD